MTRKLTLALSATCLMALTACMSEGVDGDSNQGRFLIEHTGPGTVYWQE